ncbi:MAG: hypothetical protein AB7F64_03480 [Gammaproteobacteria bacterium]
MFRKLFSNRDNPTNVLLKLAKQIDVLEKDFISLIRFADPDTKSKRIQTIKESTEKIIQDLDGLKGKSDVVNADSENHLKGRAYYLLSSCWRLSIDFPPNDESRKLYRTDPEYLYKDEHYFNEARKYGFDPRELHTSNAEDFISLSIKMKRQQ